jgi:hypothetical protein
MYVYIKTIGKMPRCNVAMASLSDRPP